jgi:hypothetical protein
VNGIFLFPNQCKNSVEAALAEWDFKSSARSKSKGADPRDVSQKKIFKARIVRYVQKNRTFPNVNPCGALRLSSATNARS